MKSALYAKADGNRKPWYISALIYHEGSDREERFVVIHRTEDQAAKWVEAKRLERGLSNCRYYAGEGFFTIEG